MYLLIEKKGVKVIQLKIDLFYGLTDIISVQI